MPRSLQILRKLYASGKNIRVPSSVQYSTFLVQSPMEREIHSKVAEIRENVLKLTHNESNVGMFWRLTSFPIDPEFYRYKKEVQNELEKISQWRESELVELLRLAEPEYPDDVKEVASGSPSPRQGEYFDVVSLMSSFGGGDLVRNNGNRVALSMDTFEGKYVMVCCFHVPVLVGSFKESFLSFVHLCNELYSSRDDFEMVVVAKMNSMADDREVFDHFFSAFPESCLAVPFEDNQRRECICNVLGLGLGLGLTRGLHECLIMSPEGKVLPGLRRYSISDYHGADAFPFTEEIMYKSYMECRDLIHGGASLERILRCNDSSPDFVYKIDSREEVPISQLSNEVKNKHVGVYLCSWGDFLPDLVNIYEKCREKQLEFEIVLVYLPFVGLTNLEIFQENIDSLLEKHNVCGSWWCLPFNNSVSRRFWQITLQYDTEDGMGYGPQLGDKLIVVGPGVKQLDIYGDCVVRSEQGIDAFPFTVEAAIHARMKELREITLESLFVDEDTLFFRGNDRSDAISLKELQGRKIFLCIDKLRVESYHDRNRKDYEIIASIYNEMKEAEDESFEMVSVEVKSSDHALLADEERGEILSKMPWYVCPINQTNWTNLKELMRLLNGKRDVIVGFGGDGRVCSVQVIGHFSDSDCRATKEHVSLGADLYYGVERILGYDCFDDYQREYSFGHVSEQDWEKEWASRYADDHFE